MEISFIPLDYDSFDWQGRNYVKIVGRDEKGKRVCIIDCFQPYLWAMLKEGTSEKKAEDLRKKIEKIKIETSLRTTNVEKTELCEKNFLGKPVKAIKIFITNYKDAHPVADNLDFPEIEARREYDLNIITKYIAEKRMVPLKWCRVSGEVLNNSSEFGGIDSAIDADLCIKAEKIEECKDEIIDKRFEPKILAFDIEADELEIGKGEILMISLVGKNLKKVLTWKKCPHRLNYVECFKDEADMLEAFVNYVKKENPDMLIGYFSDGFDLPYLKARAEKNKVRLSLGIDNSQPSFARGRIPSGKIFGIVHVDLFRFIETAYSQYLQSETLGLNEVASELLGEGKREFEHKSSKQMKQEEWQEYFEYNLQDSVLTYKLAEKFWPDMLEFSKIVQEPLFEIARDSMSQMVENYIIHNLHKFSEIAEKRPLHDEIEKRREREKYEGAFVFQPQAALYENLAVFDFTSYWPSIIVTYNLSLSSFLKNREKDALEVSLGSKKAYFSKKPAFFPLMLKEVIELRKKYKQEYKKDKNPLTFARSNAYKLLANASYGYQGFFGARYYCPEASAATTAISRDFIKKIIGTINQDSYEVIYSDTDSIALKLNRHAKQEALSLLEKLNSGLPGIMELELEDFYKRGIWVTKRTGEFGAKKKYALINHESKLKIRGFETVRRDWCTLARDLQNKVLHKILQEGNEKSALELVKKTIKDLKERNIDKKDIMIRTQLKKSIAEYRAITPHVIAAQKMKEKGLPVDIGMLIEYFIAETREKKALVREKVKLPDEKGEYNIKYYLEHQIIPAVENIFNVFNINIKEVADGKQQKKLGEF
ncbi:ribonuclease H-like domain-containing protein [Candidatus Pacearchaeota archaeon]|nr:ribonuclease H-like domain-containing protein [Candidatus Pacearchaeota archaeon]